MKKIESLKEDINNSLKEIQENTGKQVEALKEETNKSLKEIQENTIKQVKELNKNIQDITMEIETVARFPLSNYVSAERPVIGQGKGRQS